MCECNLVFIGSVCSSTRLHCSIACLCCNLAVGAHEVNPRSRPGLSLSSRFYCLPHTVTAKPRNSQTINNTSMTHSDRGNKLHRIWHQYTWFPAALQPNEKISRFCAKNISWKSLSRLEFCVFIENVLFRPDERGKFASVAHFTEIGWRWGIMLN